MWKETLALWLLLLLVVGVLVEMRAGSLCPPEQLVTHRSWAGSLCTNGPALSCLVCPDLWLHLYANTNNLLLS